MISCVVCLSYVYKITQFTYCVLYVVNGYECNISVNAGISRRGYIAAQARASPNDDSGFVFKQCNVSGQGNTFLGRAWKSYSRVIYYDSFFAAIITPKGRDAWDIAGQE
ncbi:plant invertase/pectin methylesterase inhibitor [Striga asiatica]|uniref:pectinesterase n=1 Tax=Striga asiatica TaxID=4170 RepID=A0A5A7R1B5_STRAF|nr:plant invertase/pectin methylesterase inhibitor [Striga asiatica]